ncbi:MAG: hypothetical protein ACI8RZ_003513 [Myxococcota bacterium]
MDSGSSWTPIDTADTTPGASLQITNSGVSPAVQVLWRNNLCEEVPYHTLLPGDSISQTSYEEHVWVARNTDGVVLDYIVTPAGSAWEIPP